MYTGKHYRHKDDPQAEPFTVVEERGELLKLSNGASCKISTLTENYVQTEQIDPESFFRNSTNVLQSAVNGRAVSVGDGGNGPSQSTSQIIGDAPPTFAPPRPAQPQAPIGRPVTEHYEPQYEPQQQPQYPPQQQFPSQQQFPPQQQYAPQQPQQYQQYPPQQYPQHPQQMPPQPYYPQQQQPAQPQYAPAPTPPPPSPREEASRILRNIKRNTEVTFNFELAVNIPERDVARMANNMFNDLSYVDFLTEDLLARISYDKDYLGTRIREQILAYINGEQKRAKKKPAPAPAPAPVKKATRKRTKPANEDPQ